MRLIPYFIAMLTASALFAAPSIEPASPLQWQSVALTFDGPQTSEAATPNPFTDYRMSVTFTKDGTALTATGFFAADGDAANTSATEGNKWRVRFTPPEPGRWTWRASFRTGSDAALSDNPSAGNAVAFDGETGVIDVSPAPANARGFQSKGYLQYVNGHYLRFQNGEYFVKGGAGSPENFLGYFEFDGTFDTAAHGGIVTDTGSFLHHYAPHAGDWRPGDPTWQGGKGKNIIGALNYLSSKGMNSLYFLTYNLDGGDGKDTWMWTAPDIRDRFDVSKLDQWEIVFSHMERSGILMHVFIQETENDEELGGSPKLNRTRQLYLRELVARFGHHLGIVWDLGEENDTPRLDRLDISRYITSLEAVAHPVTAHTHNMRARRSYTSMIGAPEFQATAIQGRMEDANAETISLRARSAWSGQPWVIFHDEQAPASVGAMPDSADPAHDKPRKQELWGNLMGGGSGVEWYFGYNYPHMDLNIEDWRSRDILWDQTRYALEFFRQHLPFWEMWPANDLTSTDNVYVFAKEGEIYAVYSPEAEATQITLSSGEYSLEWYNPRTGGPLVKGPAPTIAVNDNLMRDEGAVRLTPPSDRGKDWIALLKRIAP